MPRLPGCTCPPGDEGWHDCAACEAQAEALDQIAEMTMTQVEGCACADYSDADDCRCLACAERAMGTAGCPHRLDQIMAGQARNDRLYDGMCDQCFKDARDVRDCGLRTAEHAS